MNIDTEIQKLYKISAEHSESIVDIYAKVSLCADEIRKASEINAASLTDTTKSISALAAQVQILHEEVLRLNKRFPEQ